MVWADSVIKELKTKISTVTHAVYLRKTGETKKKEKKKEKETSGSGCINKI